MDNPNVISTKEAIRRFWQGIKEEEKMQEPPDPKGDGALWLLVAYVCWLAILAAEAVIFRWVF